MGQVLAFTLCVLQVPIRDITWAVLAAQNLDIWDIVYNSLLNKILEKDIPSSDLNHQYRVETNTTMYLQLRQYQTLLMLCTVILCRILVL